VLGGGSFFYGLGGFDFSYDELKRAVVIGLIGFFLFIASAASGFLYLKQITHNYKTEKKNDQEIDHVPFSLHLRPLNSQYHGKLLSLLLTHLSSPTMATA